nr:Dol-P-Man:Man(7)GlcNAc(2)-PP-Dol alpha-1,6-mannosyltransferase [Ipomoea batatas]
MAKDNKTRSLFNGLLKDGSFKWLNKTLSSLGEDAEEMEKDSSSSGKNWLPELSPLANVVVRRCSKILDTPMKQLHEIFDGEASDTLKHPSQYARNFLEYCSFRTLALAVQVSGYLGDRSFRRLTFDMMAAWEFPAAASKPFASMDEDVTVGVEAFSRIAVAVPIIANVIVSDNIFSVLSSSTGGRLQFAIYAKYLSGLERGVKKLKGNSESSHLSSLRSARGEKILELEGTVTTQPVLQHVGISTWPGMFLGFKLLFL